jgi:hypothetical protein
MRPLRPLDPSLTKPYVFDYFISVLVSIIWLTNAFVFAPFQSLPMLEQFKHDDVAAVSESCQVALDLHEYYNSDSFQYADGLVKSD